MVLPDRIIHTHYDEFQVGPTKRRTGNLADMELAIGTDWKKPGSAELGRLKRMLDSVSWDILSTQKDFSKKVLSMIFVCF